jgi:nitrogen fixation/metabolism regulation signal transduction histidine kinase
MLDQSRHSPEIPTDFDAVKLIRDLVVLTRYQIPEHIQIQVDAHQSIPVNLPESGFRQALLNLILNSADALEKSPGCILIKAYSEKKRLIINVLDNGPGFSKDILNYGIRPFRTSHQRGTGLGLAMVQRFVKDVGGTIELTNQQAHGASVTLLLPGSIIVGGHS